MSGHAVILGAGISGLLVAAELARSHRVTVVERRAQVPRDKYWLSDASCLDANPEFRGFVDRTYDRLRFEAYDGTSTDVRGTYHLWDTDSLIEHLLGRLRRRGASVLTGSRFYSYSEKCDGLSLHVTGRSIDADLVLDCMGFSSPIVAAKRVVHHLGYYVLYGGALQLRQDIVPVGLHNVILAGQPSYFEILPTSKGVGQATLIVPGRTADMRRGMRSDFEFVVEKTRYADYISDARPQRVFHGVVPAGRLRTRALNRIGFYGEAGHVHPAASATTFTHLLLGHKDIAARLSDALSARRLDAATLSRALEPPLNRFNRRYHEFLFEEIHRMNSDGFRRLVLEMDQAPDAVVYDLIFGKLDVRSGVGRRLLGRAVRDPFSVLARTLARTAKRLLRP